MQSRTLPVDLSELHRSHYVAMVRLATLLVGSQAVAEEVVQDCFVRLLGKLGTIDQPGGGLAWSAHMLAPGSSIHVPTSRSWVPPSWVTPWRRCPSVSERCYQDLSVAQIAATLGCRPGTAKSLVHRGLAGLREVLGE